ncbi:hypothetical protein EYF80_023730 [Liparis tanakae]|uniref:Uncharacterized protein n=1 Tax=Liparis tanakae TaxID=230148 RepID=A0A4Z2HMT6_9TELE|nr:hypothetical protein EYF80_023730 [Liparis tanakae]
MQIPEPVHVPQCLSWNSGQHVATQLGDPVQSFVLTPNSGQIVETLACRGTGDRRPHQEAQAGHGEGCQHGKEVGVPREKMRPWVRSNRSRSVQKAKERETVFLAKKANVSDERRCVRPLLIWPTFRSSRKLLDPTRMRRTEAGPAERRAGD